jgi:CelD/BcsL family acetyltransferase involved in cellulose biosynthesis
MAARENLSIEVHESPESLERLRPEWEALLAVYPYSTTFSTLEWLMPWWRAFGEGDRLQVLAFRDASAALVGIAPLALTRLSALPMPLRLLRLMGDGSHDSDNLDLPVHSGREAEVSAALLGWMERSAQRWDVCELNTLPSSSLVGNQLLSDLTAQKWTCVTSHLPQSVVELPDSWESYLKGISSKERGKIGLRARRLEKKYKVQIRRCVEERELESCLEALFQLHAKHWQLRGLPGTLHAPARRQFYYELAQALQVGKRLEFWILEADGKIVATQFGLRHNDTVFSLQEGFDPDYSADSVGYVLRSQVLKQVISEGVRKYDFLGGTDDSKIRWGAQLKNYSNIHFARPLTRGSFHLSVKRKAAGAKQWLRSHLPTEVWQTLKNAAGVAPKRS